MCLLGLLVVVVGRRGGGVVGVGARADVQFEPDTRKENVSLNGVDCWKGKGREKSCMAVIEDRSERGKHVPFSFLPAFFFRLLEDTFLKSLSADGFDRPVLVVVDDGRDLGRAVDLLVRWESGRVCEGRS